MRIPIAILVILTRMSFAEVAFDLPDGFVPFDQQIELPKGVNSIQQYVNAGERAQITIIESIPIESESDADNYVKRILSEGKRNGMTRMQVSKDRVRGFISRRLRYQSMYPGTDLSFTGDTLALFTTERTLSLRLDLDEGSEFTLGTIDLVDRLKISESPAMLNLPMGLRVAELMFNILVMVAIGWFVYKIWQWRSGQSNSPRSEL